MKHLFFVLLWMGAIFAQATTITENREGTVAG